MPGGRATGLNADDSTYIVCEFLRAQTQALAPRRQTLADRETGIAVVVPEEALRKIHACRHIVRRGSPIP